MNNFVSRLLADGGCCVVLKLFVVYAFLALIFCLYCALFWCKDSIGNCKLCTSTSVAGFFPQKRAVGGCEKAPYFSRFRPKQHWKAGHKEECKVVKGNGI